MTVQPYGLRWFRRALAGGVLVAAMSGCSRSDTAAMERIRETYPHCAKPVQCGSLFYVDCGVAIDLESYYLDENGKEISTCGGACWKAKDPKQIEVCANSCPPPAWDCPRE